MHTRTYILLSFAFPSAEVHGIRERSPSLGGRRGETRDFRCRIESEFYENETVPRSLSSDPNAKVLVGKQISLGHIYLSSRASSALLCKPIPAIDRPSHVSLDFHMQIYLHILFSFAFHKYTRKVLLHSLCKFNLRCPFLNYFVPLPMCYLYNFLVSLSL